MILTTIKNLEHYLGIHPNLDTALQYIMIQNLTELPNGTTHIQGDEVYVNHFHYTTHEETMDLEAHERYADIHILLHGKEYIGYCDISASRKTTAYDKINDSCLYQASQCSYAFMDPTMVLIAFPEDAHQPKIMAGTVQEIDKIVFKVKLR